MQVNNYHKCLVFGGSVNVLISNLVARYHVDIYRSYNENQLIIKKMYPSIEGIPS